MKMRFEVALSTLLIVLITAGALLLNLSLHSTARSMQFIEERIRPSGAFVDYDNAIAVTSAGDLGWWMSGGNWYVMYGKIQLEFTPSQLRNADFLAQVGRIGLDVRGDLEKGELRFFWFGTELEEWVPR